MVGVILDPVPLSSCSPDPVSLASSFVVPLVPPALFAPQQHLMFILLCKFLSIVKMIKF